VAEAWCSSRRLDQDEGYRGKGLLSQGERLATTSVMRFPHAIRPVAAPHAGRSSPGGPIAQPAAADRLLRTEAKNTPFQQNAEGRGPKATEVMASCCVDVGGASKLWMALVSPFAD